MKKSYRKWTDRILTLLLPQSRLHVLQATASSFDRPAQHTLNSRVTTYDGSDRGPKACQRYSCPSSSLLLRNTSALSNTAPGTPSHGHSLISKFIPPIHFIVVFVTLLPRNLAGRITISSARCLTEVSHGQYW